MTKQQSKKLMDEWNIANHSHSHNPLYYSRRVAKNLYKGKGAGLGSSSLNLKPRPIYHSIGLNSQTNQRTPTNKQ